jgi:TM2 domain-containing membrane protein YozV
MTETAVARPVAGRALLAAALAWLLPGAGHFYLGRRRRAVAFLLLVAASLLLGCAFDGKLWRIVANEPLSVLGTLGSMGVGPAYFVLRYGLDYHGDPVAPGFEYGSAFLLTAGLMNLLLILDAWDITRGSKE